MPTYDYICKSCNAEFEKFQPITAKELRKCPLCGKASLKRLIGCGSGIIFKGSGFYQTDYRSEGYRKAASSEKPAASDQKKGGKTPSPADNSPTKAQEKKAT